MSKRRARWQAPHPAEKRRTCVWGKCQNPPYSAEIPICRQHITVAHGIRQRDLDGTATPLTITVDLASAPEPQSESQVEPPEAGTIYFARSGGYVKIGWTSDLGRRMKAYPPDTRLLATMPGTRKDERALHRKFAHLLTYGREWFPLAPQITEHIDRVVREHGEPPTVDFAAKPATRIVGPRLHNYVGGPRGNMTPTTVRG